MQPLPRAHDLLGLLAGQLGVLDQAGGGRPVDVDQPAVVERLGQVRPADPQLEREPVARASDTCTGVPRRGRPATWWRAEPSHSGATELPAPAVASGSSRKDP